MQPMQFSSCAVIIGNQPRRFGVVRQAKTSTGQTARQKPHALHISSPTTTSQRPAGPFGGFLSALNSGIAFPVHWHHRADSSPNTPPAGRVSQGRGGQAVAVFLAEAG